MSAPTINPLFRAEALAHRNGAQEGGIRLAGLHWHRPAAALAVLLLAAVVLLGILGQASRKARVPGVVLPQGGLLHLASPQAGRLLALHVQQGDVVHTGQRLATLQISGAGAMGDTAQGIGLQLRARQSALQAERRSLLSQASQRETSLRERARSIAVELTLAGAEREAVQQRAALAEQAEARDQQLHQQGFVSAGQLQTREAERLDATVRVHTVRRTQQTLQREAETLIADIDALRSQTTLQLAQLDRAAAALEQERHELDGRSHWVITAPAEGTVGALAASLGQQLIPGQTVLSLSARPAQTADSRLPALQASLFAPSRAIGFVTAGQPVWLRLHAYPHQKFGMVAGRVDEVSRTPVAPADLPAGLGPLLLSAAGAQEPLYRITVALQSLHVDAYGKPQPLKPGMTLEADILQEQRALWEWLFEPLLAARTRWWSRPADPL